MENQQGGKMVNPKQMLIQVTQQGQPKVNVRIPFFLVKMGLKFGQMAVDAKQAGGHDQALEYLKEVDLDSVMQALHSGEASLPMTLVDVDEPEKNTHVNIVLE